MSYVQAPPWCLQIEPTEGCNLRCNFCGIRGIRDAVKDRDNLSGPYRFMSPATASLIARQVAAAGWRPRIEIAMHGEPTMNPNIVKIVGALHRHLPKQPIMLTTNGIPMLPRWDTMVPALFDAGCTTIAVDDYRPHKARKAVLNTGIRGVVVYRYPEDGPVANPHKRPRPKDPKRLVLVKDISQADEGTHSHLSNHAGAAGPPDHTYDNERCALPFREISLRWDGSVALCCNDWRGQYKIGNVHKLPIDMIWQHDAFQAARRRLFKGRRDFAPCQGCTHRTSRNGLLPDGTGKTQVPAPTPYDKKILEDAIAGDSYTAPVRRKWEAGDK